MRANRCLSKGHCKRIPPRRKEVATCIPIISSDGLSVIGAAHLSLALHPYEDGKITRATPGVNIARCKRHTSHHTALRRGVKMGILLADRGCIHQTHQPIDHVPAISRIRCVADH